MTPRVQTLFMLVVFALGVMVAVRALGHEQMGRFGSYGVEEYLYGREIGNADDVGPVNCCLYKNAEGEQGDCKLYPEENVKIVPGGYLLADGEFIAQHDTNVSPPDPVTGEYYFYRCRHDAGGGWGDNPKTHCFFAPPTGM